MAAAQIPSNAQKTGYSYLALGDSYTIGEAVQPAESFPFQMQKMLGEKGIIVHDPKIIATTGWTTDELQKAIKEAHLTQKFNLVTLLIGVNNQYRKYPLNTYKKEFSELLQTAIDFADGQKENVFVVSIPDWGVTPFAKDADRSKAQIAAEIDLFNAANKEITLAKGIAYVDITPHSREAEKDKALIASDGLHPSGKMYAFWAKELAFLISKNNK
ncbi:SGNH/GDSL hydrolase family protein [Pedobacter sp. MW01-1-1]|uniref:SGNH/GDSL hydrolase family protein n=1 Tax=Pedobacter sp. MW01-1-1 TaxID=3383027 RepID=UPI003FF06533